MRAVFAASISKASRWPSVSLLQFGAPRIMSFRPCEMLATLRNTPWVFSRLFNKGFISSISISSNDGASNFRWPIISAPLSKPIWTSISSSLRGSIEPCVPNTLCVSVPSKGAMNGLPSSRSIPEAFQFPLL